MRVLPKEKEKQWADFPRWLKNFRLCWESNSWPPCPKTFTLPLRQHHSPQFQRVLIIFLLYFRWRASTEKKKPKEDPRSFELCKQTYKSSDRPKESFSAQWLNVIQFILPYRHRVNEKGIRTLSLWSWFKPSRVQIFFSFLSSTLW